MAIRLELRVVDDLETMGEQMQPFQPVQQDKDDGNLRSYQAQVPSDIRHIVCVPDADLLQLVYQILLYTSYTDIGTDPWTNS
jgi:hypothetical protein